MEEISEISVDGKIHDSPSTPDICNGTPPAPAKTRLLNRQSSVHQILGGGKSADVLLWKHKFTSGGIVIGSTIIWLLFEKLGYTLLSILANSLLILFVLLFTWSKVAAFLKRSPPPLPKLELSEEFVISLALSVHQLINNLLDILYDIALGNNFMPFLKAFGMLWGFSSVGGRFHFLTLVYILIIVAYSVPVVYERYEDQIDEYAKKTRDRACHNYRAMSSAVVAKVPRGLWMGKKVQ